MRMEAINGSDHLVDPTAGGLIRSVRTRTTLHLQTFGRVQSDMATVEPRYGPWTLCEDNDNMVEPSGPLFITTALLGPPGMLWPTHLPQMLQCSTSECTDL